MNSLRMRQLRMFLAYSQNPLEKGFEVLFYGIIAGATLLYIFLRPLYQIGGLNDDAVYVIVASDFWHTLKSHPLLGIKPDSPLPGLPLLLAPFATLVAPHWLLLEWLSSLASSLTVLVLGLWARLRLSSRETLAAMALFALNPLVARLSGVVMPEPYYALGGIACFYLVECLLARPSRKTALLVGVGLGWASLLRPEGVVLLISVIGVAACTRALRQWLHLIILPLVGWLLLVFLWFHSRQTPSTEFGGDITALLAFWTTHPTEAFPFSMAFLQVLLQASCSWMPQHSSWAGSVFPVALALLLMAGAAIGLVSCWQDNRLNRTVLVAVAAFCGLYFSVHVFWHVDHPRYLVPLMPYAVVFLVRGFDRALRWSRMGKLRPVLLGVVLLFHLQDDGRAVHQALYAPDPMNAPPWRSLEYLRTHSRPTARITSNISPAIELFSGRSSMGMLNVSNAEEFYFLALHRRLEYMVIRSGRLITPAVAGSPDPNVTVAQYRRWVRHYPDRFPLVFANAEEGTEIYRIVVQAAYVDAYARYIAAIDDLRGGRSELAMSKARECLALFPELASAHNLMAALLFNRSQDREAEKHLLTAAEIAPDSTKIALNLATLYRRRGEQRRCFEYLASGLSMSRVNRNAPEFVEYYKGLRLGWEKERWNFLVHAPNTKSYGQIPR